MALAHDDPDRNRPPGRRIERRPLARAVRTEPALDIPSAALATWSHEPAKILYLRDSDRPLDTAPGDPLGAASPLDQTPTRRRTNAAIAASVLLHLLIALAFVQLSGDEVKIAGGEVPQVALLGNAPEDASAAGDSLDQPEPEITSVTILTMLDAQPVTTAEATLSPVDLEQPLEAETAIEQVSPDEVETVAPVETVAAVHVTTEAAPVAQVVEPALIAPQAPAASPVTDMADAAKPVEPLLVPASLAPEVLTAERVEPADPLETVPFAAASVAEPVDTVLAELVDTETEPVDPVREVAQALPERPAPSIEPVTPTVQPVRETAVVQPSRDVAVATPVEDPTPSVKERPVVKKPPPPKPEPRPKVSQEKAAPAKVKPAKAKPTEAKSGPKADTRKGKPAGKPAAKSGSKGKAEADARRGEADGAVDGSSAAKGKGKARSAAAGNAAVTNYPGKIVSKLRRALRYPAQAKSQNLRGEVQVSFTVSSGGAVGGVRVVRSSGSPVLDRAAIETVRRAAPFPPIPEGAGRSSWPFTVPLAFMR